MSVHRMCESTSFSCLFCRNHRHEKGYSVEVGRGPICICTGCVDLVQVIAREMSTYFEQEQARNADEQRAATDAAMLELAAALKAHTAALKTAAPPVAVPPAPDPAEIGEAFWHCLTCDRAWNGSQNDTRCRYSDCASSTIEPVVPAHKKEG